MPLYIDSTSALHVAGNCTSSPCAKHIALRYFFVQELVEKGKVSIQYVKTEDQLADLGPKHLSKHRHRNVIKLIKELKAKNANKLIVFQGGSSSPCARNTCVLLILFSATRVFTKVHVHCTALL